MNPVAKSRTYKMMLVALFAALIAVGAFIRVPVPLVPFTMQTFFVVLAGMLLGKKLGGASALVYLAIGLIGIPVFTQGGGIGYVLKPSFGYLIGFVVAAFITGAIVRKRRISPSGGCWSRAGRFARALRDRNGYFYF
jgi:biotin transport system substrate-specific component